MKKRHYGIDLLRIVSMLMIVCWHVIAYGGVWTHMTRDMLHYPITWAAVVFGHCAVDCYVLISGYVGVTSSQRRSAPIKLWLQVAFYSVGVTALFCLFKPGTAGVKELALSFFPVLFEQYWFFLAYFLLALFMPLLNAGIASLTRRQAKTLVLCLFFFFSLVPCVLESGIIDLPSGYLHYVDAKAGYSVWWFILLYVMGGCIRRFDLLACLRKRVCVTGYLLMGLITLLVKLLGERINGFLISPDLLLSYSSPTILLCAIMLLGLFAKLETMPGWLNRAIGWLAPLTFGVYLIHDHPLVRTNLIAGRLFPSGAGQFSPLGYVIRMAGWIAAIYLACSLIEFARRKLFDALKINRRMETLWKHEDA